MNLIKRYYWKELSSDGLLKEPEAGLTDFDYIELNDNNEGYVNEETALSELEQYQSILGGYVGKMVLITVWEDYYEQDSIKSN